MTETVILLPGLLCDAAAWQPQLEAIRPHRTVHVADLAPFDSFDAMARAALALAPGPLAVAGHSMGARVALEMLRLAPGRVARLALLDTGVHPRRDGEEASRQTLVDLAYAEGMPALADTWLPPMVHEARHADPAVMARLRAMVLRATPDSHARQIHALLTRPDARPGLPAIRVPTLVLVGRQDRWSPVAQHEEIARAIPGARLVVVEDAGHFAPVERPGPVNAALLDWLGLANPA